MTTVERRPCWIEVVSRVSRYRGLLWYGNGFWTAAGTRSELFLSSELAVSPPGIVERACSREKWGGEGGFDWTCLRTSWRSLLRLWLMQRHDFHPYNWMEFLKRLMRGNGIQVSCEIYLIPTYTTFPRASDNYSRRENFYEGWMRSNVCKSFPIDSDRIVLIFQLSLYPLISLIIWAWFYPISILQVICKYLIITVKRVRLKPPSDSINSIVKPSNSNGEWI